MQWRNRISLFLLSFNLAVANAAWAHPEYRVTVMGPANSAATDINDAGVVVGTYPFSPTTTHGFLNRGKGFVDLGTLGGTSSNTVAINDNGKVLGHWTTKAGQQRGFIYYRGKQRDIGIIPGRPTTFTDINNAGYITAIGYPRSFLRSPTGTYTDIGFLPYDDPVTNAYALNNRNQITGESGPLTFPEQTLRTFIWAKGVMRELAGLGAEPTAGLAINDHGQITGYAALPLGFFDRHAVLHSNGRVIDIDGRPDTGAPDDNTSEGTGINNHAHIVGTSNHLSGFIWRGKRMQSLNALIDRKSGWNIGSPQAINDAGQIAATATRKGVQYAVRLDLIRPIVTTAPQPQLDEEGALPAQRMSPAEAAAEAEAQAREVVRPVSQ
ncbi:MAG TPA: HAF repeat-containing protein [Telluria sp.]